MPRPKGSTMTIEAPTIKPEEAPTMTVEAPTFHPVERVDEEPQAKWYLCPDCQGRGWVPVESAPPSQQPVRVLQGVRVLRHVPCPRCQRTLMIKSVGSEEDGMALKPIKLCPLCKNWYAVGGGRSRRVPCPHREHAERSHCHWHDLSVYPPPDNQTGNRLKPAQTIEW